MRRRNIGERKRRQQRLMSEDLDEKLEQLENDIEPTEVIYAPRKDTTDFYITDFLEESGNEESTKDTDNLPSWFVVMVWLIGVFLLGAGVFLWIYSKG